ncbi:MAG: hypothetical protein Q4F97_08715 [Bacteroidales bacterium]|nr:hypothetical protein [Bacteroidales bacterium]
MKNIILTIITVLSFQLVSAQEERINGFLFPTFSQAKILYKTGKTQENSLNYDAISQQMVFVKNDQVLAIANPMVIDTIFIKGRKFIPNKDDAFYEIINYKNGSVYIERKSELINAGKEGGYGTFSQTSATTSFDSFSSSTGRYSKLTIKEKIEETIKDRFFVKINDNMVPVDNLKKIIKVFPDKKDAIKDFVKNNEINCKNDDDLLYLLLFCLN